MAVIYEDVIPSLIPNTTMVKGIVDGVHRNYRITPNEGYVLHDKANDYADLDHITMTEIPKLGYAIGTVSCGANYDFTPVQVTDENGETHTAYGSAREFFARLASEVPADQIFGGGDEHEHEIM